MIYVHSIQARAAIGSQAKAVQKHSWSQFPLQCPVPEVNKAPNRVAIQLRRSLLDLFCASNLCCQFSAVGQKRV